MGSDDGGATLRAFRAVLADRRLRRLQYALLGSVLGRFGSLVALGVWAYRIGGPGLVGVRVHGVGGMWRCRADASAARAARRPTGMMAR